MAFSETIINRVRQMAAYHCCWCQMLGIIHVHHIIPVEESGPDNIDNAAPLCLNCHESFGSNPKFRKKIRARRDHWYRIAAVKYSYYGMPLENVVRRIDDELGNIRYDATAAKHLKKAVSEYINGMLDLISPQTAYDIVNQIVEAVPLDTGIMLPKDMIAAEGFCQCKRERCVGHSAPVYCYWSKYLSEWVLNKQLYWRCYDQIMMCPECGLMHKRGHIGAPDICMKRKKTKKENGFNRI